MVMDDIKCHLNRAGQVLIYPYHPKHCVGNGVLQSHTNKLLECCGMLWGVAMALGPIENDDNSRWPLIGQVEEVCQRKEVHWQVEAICHIDPRGDNNTRDGCRGY